MQYELKVWYFPQFLKKNFKSLFQSIVFLKKIPKFSVRIKTIEYAR